MEEIRLEVQPRASLGKQKVKTLRREQLIPGIVYGGGKAAQAVQIDRRTYERIRRQHHGEIVFSLNLPDGKKKDGTFYAMVREEQHHPVTEQILHVDFIRISLTEKIEAHVAVEVKGEPVGVKRDGGSLDHLLWELTVECLPTNIPEKIVVDVSSMEIDQTVHVKDLVLPEGVVAKHDPEALVLAVTPPRKEEVAEPTGEEGPEEPEVIKEKKEEAPAEEAAGEAEPKKKEE